MSDIGLISRTSSDPRDGATRVCQSAVILDEADAEGCSVVVNISLLLRSSLFLVHVTAVQSRVLLVVK